MIKKYLKIVIFGGALASFFALIGATFNGNLKYNFWIFRCSPDGYSDTNFLSYCSDRAFGNYEHLALYAGLEPEAVRNLSEAQVLFLGNSKARRAFSSGTFKKFFDDMRIRDYNLAFGYGEYDLFPKMLIQKHRPPLRALIINADYFFYGLMSSAAKEVVRAKEQNIGFTMALKARIQPVHAKVCGSDPLSWIAALVCDDKATTLFRSRIDGRTTYLNVNLSRSYPATLNEEGRPPNYDVYLKNARDFLADIDIDPGCVFLTVVPSMDTDRRVAKHVARALRLQYIETFPGPYVTYDGNHLKPKSAERWSSMFLSHAKESLTRCAEN